MAGVAGVGGVHSSTTRTGRSVGVILSAPAPPSFAAPPSSPFSAGSSGEVGRKVKLISGKDNYALVEC